MKRASSFTNAPPLRSNLFVGSLQILFWLFFHPAAWRHHLRRLDDQLRPDFCLAELEGPHWRQPAMHRLLIMLYLTWPILVGALIAVSLWLLGVRAEGVLLGVVIGVAVGVMVGTAVTIVGSVAIGTAMGSRAGKHAAIG